MSAQRRSVATSTAAATLQTPAHTGQVKGVILGLFRRFGPMPDHELVDRYELHLSQAEDVPAVTPQSIRTRRHELTTAGAIVDSGRETRTPPGNRSKIWALAEERTR